MTHPHAGKWFADVGATSFSHSYAGVGPLFFVHMLVRLFLLPTNAPTQQNPEGTWSLCSIFVNWPFIGPNFKLPKATNQFAPLVSQKLDLANPSAPHIQNCKFNCLLSHNAFHSPNQSAPHYFSNSQRSCWFDIRKLVLLRRVSFSCGELQALITTMRWYRSSLTCPFTGIWCHTAFSILATQWLWLEFRRSRDIQ